MSLIMGIVNVTADSFSDGGTFLAPQAAVAQAKALAASGADLIDIGGESTRPGAQRVPANVEHDRVVPVVQELAGQGLRISVDTMRAEVARACLAAGASMINDVSGGQADPDMLEVLAHSNADYVLMHWRAHSAHMQDLASYADVVAEVRDELLVQRDRAVAAGIAPDRIVLDPGLGFAKTAEHNWQLLRHLTAFTGLGHRVLIGASRKAFLGAALGGREPQGRDTATAAVTFWCAQQGVWAVRTHDVITQVDALAVARQLSGR